MWSWREFCDAHGVEYVEHGQGPNVAHGFINIKCPFCAADPSHHMGLSLTGTFWGCWRDESHRGKSPAWLVHRLLSCSLIEARRIVGEVEQGVPTAINLGDLRARLEGGAEEVEESPAVELLPEFFTLQACFQRSARFLEYLRRRGFRKPRSLARKYGLLAANRGDFKQRLVVPFYVDGVLRGWTGRAIAPSKIRYKSFPSGRALAGVLFEPRDLWESPKGTPIVFVEGPLDALKLDYYARGACRAVGVLGTAYTRDRVARMLALVERMGGRCGVLFDRGATAQALALQSELGPLRPALLRLPHGVGDPGELSPRGVPWVLRGDLLDPLEPPGTHFPRT